MFQGNWVDLLIILVILVFIVDGFRSGLISGILELFGFLISLLTALLTFSKVALVFTTFFAIPESFATAVGFFVAWLVTESVYFFTARRLFSKIPPQITGHAIVRLTGFVPAAVNGLLLWAFLLTLITAIPAPGNIKSAIFSSEIGGVLVSKTSQLEKPLQQVFGPAVSDIQKGLTFLTVVPESRQVVQLDFTQPEFTIDPISEAKMVDLVNQERIQRGLTALTVDFSLREVGRNHSADMFSRGYFSHYSPEGKDVGDRLIEAGISYFVAGENLAYAPDVIRAHQGLMDSPGHRQNILTAEFKKIGIGVVDGGIYGKMFTQVFTD